LKGCSPAAGNKLPVLEQPATNKRLSSTNVFAECFKNMIPPICLINDPACIVFLL
jgi:hypothetical protein